MGFTPRVAFQLPMMCTRDITPSIPCLQVPSPRSPHEPLTNTRIDLHAHIVVSEIQRNRNESEAWRPRVVRGDRGELYVETDVVRIGPVLREISDVGRIVEHMDTVGIDHVVLSPAPFCLYPYLDTETAVKAASIQNDALARIISEYPDRVSALGCVPMQDPERAAEELVHVRNDLGLVGAILLTNVGGEYLGRKQFRPVFAAAAETEALIFLHPDNVLGAERLQDYYLANLVGYPIETAASAAHLVFSGIFEEFPTLKILLAHGGGAMPYVHGRWQWGYHQRSEAKAGLKKPPDAYLRNFYIDTVIHDGAALRYAIEVMTPNHVVVGSDFPFDMGPDDPLALLESLALDAVTFNQIAGQTAVKLIGLGAHG